MASRSLVTLMFFWNWQTPNEAPVSCEDQALSATKVCVKWECERDIGRKPKLEKEGRFWCCSWCDASYGENPHPDLK